jgi:hypothetical protein
VAGHASTSPAGVVSTNASTYQSNSVNYTRHVPDALLAHGAIDAPHAGWNTATLTVPHNLAANEKVWVSLFSATGAVKYRDRPNGDCIARSTATCSSLPTQWGVQVYEGNLCPASLYVTD